ncbi:hypothetical protein EAF00_001049 [Botryotinia globosa]|nr:hypothetical protein EAF00_001049 [Botryotinia globosa]
MNSKSVFKKNEIFNGFSADLYIQTSPYAPKVGFTTGTGAPVKVVEAVVLRIACIIVPDLAMSY